MCKVFTIANQKGGVGKSVTTASLGIGLARQGKRVLLIDNDPQSSLTVCLGYPKPTELPITLANIMAGIIRDEPHPASSGVIQHLEGIDLVPSNIELSGIELSLVNVMSRKIILRQYIDDVKPLCDFILIDTSPSLGMLTINALAAADSVLIPVQAEYLPAKGLELLLKTISRVQKQINPARVIGGILLTMVDERINDAREIIGELTAAYGGRLTLFGKIPRSVRASEITKMGKSIYAHDLHGKVAAAYENLTREVLASA